MPAHQIVERLDALPAFGVLHHARHQLVLPPDEGAAIDGTPLGAVALRVLEGAQKVLEHLSAAVKRRQRAQEGEPRELRRPAGAAGPQEALQHDANGLTPGEHRELATEGGSLPASSTRRAGAAYVPWCLQVC
jgi:hypothetical protein